ncbi:uncharacterized protein UBRO_20190 [Ustilago bromivora]|uniref:Uncharacterized protein n=1 Tax=Ustilago bromivora TaxID=307758 RepID=A0A1K0GT99_9BASI|nr:uncharacterized protein UBRO_20190 [Ustilago bromivora]
MKRLEKTQLQLQCRTMIEHAYKKKEDLNVRALLDPLFGGAGPAAAARELSQQLQAGGDTNDNDSSDQAGSSTMHQASTSCTPFFASTSTPLSSTADDPADVSSPASGTSLSAKEPLSLHLREKLDGLCNQIGSMIRDLPQPEYNLLKKDGAGMPLHELFVAMTTNNVGTQNAVLATLEKQNGKSCCWCHQLFRLLLPAPRKGSLKPVTRGIMIDHMWTCAKPHMYRKYKEACCEALACQLCWHEACRGQILPQDHKELICHILRHYNHITSTLEHLTHVPNRSYGCPFVTNSRAEQCQWALHWQERQPLS